VCCFNGATPFVGKNYITDGHAVIGVFGICHENVQVKTLVGYASKRNGCQVVEVFVVVSDKILKCHGSNDSENTAEQETNVGNFCQWVSKDL